MIEKITENKQLILFDGVCNLCNSSVLKIIKHDKDNTFVFASLQSKIGKQIITHFNINTHKIDSIILVTSKTHYFIKSTAALKIAKHINGFWRLFIFFWIIPRPIRDLFYNIIAKNRYQWFGKKDRCMIPTSKIKTKFIDN